MLCVHFVPAVAVGTTTVLPKYLVDNKYRFARIFVVAVVYNAYLVGTQFCVIIHRPSRSQWSCILRRVSAAACLLGLRVRIPQGHGCVSLVSVVCCTGTGLCEGPISRLEEYRVCVSLSVIRYNNNPLHLQ